MRVTYVIEFDVKASERKRFLKLLGNVLSAMKHEENCLTATLHVDPDSPLHFMLYETWTDHDDVVQVQMKREYRREWHAALPELLEAPRRISVWAPDPDAAG